MNLPNLVNHHLYRGEERLPELSTAYDYLLAGDGLYKRARNSAIVACIQVTACRVAGLPVLPENWANRIIPAPGGYFPGHLLEDIYLDACRYGQDGLERMYHLHVDGRQAWVTIPDQTMSGYRVAYRAGANGFDPTIICDLHSHHSMPAFFSGTDDRDEQGFGYYAVIGDLFSARPQLRLRLGVYGDFLELDPRDLFDGGLGPFTGLGPDSPAPEDITWAEAETEEAVNG